MSNYEFVYQSDFLIHMPSTFKFVFFRTSSGMCLTCRVLDKIYLKCSYYIRVTQTETHTYTLTQSSAQCMHAHLSLCLFIFFFKMHAADDITWDNIIRLCLNSQRDLHAWWMVKRKRKFVISSETIWNSHDLGCWYQKSCENNRSALVVALWHKIVENIVVTPCTDVTKAILEADQMLEPN